jgi:predicted nucleic acid-binding protein
MHYLLDSCFCIACLRRKPWALEALQRVPLGDVAVSAVTVGELVAGTELSRMPGLEAKNVRAFLRPLQIIPFGYNEATSWGFIEALLRKQGNRIEAEDAMIAKHHGLTVITSNTKHFERVQGLEVLDWSK